MGDNLYNLWNTATWTTCSGTNTTTSFIIPDYDVEVKDDGNVWIRYGGTYMNIGAIAVKEPEPEVEELEMAVLPDIFDF